MWAIVVAVLLSQPANPYLDEGRRLAKELQFPEAVQQLTVARQVPGLSDKQESEVLELLARCQIALGQRTEAASTWEALLKLQADYQPDENSSPKLLDAFSAAKAKLFPENYLVLSREAAPPERVRARLVDPWRQVAALRARVNGAEVALTRDASAVSFALPRERETSQGLTWSFEAMSPEGTVLTRLTGERPPLLLVSPQLPDVVTEAPRWKRPAPWVAVGLAVLASGVGAAMQVSSMNHAAQARDGSKPPGDFADTARQAHNQAVTEATISTGLFVGAGLAGATAVVLFAW